MILPPNFSWMAAVINDNVEHGIMPAEIHFNKATFKVTMNALKHASAGAMQLTPWKRFRIWLSGVPVRAMFQGVPLCVTESLPDGVMVIRPRHLLNDGDWLNTIQKEAQARMAAVAQSQLPPQGTAPEPAELRSSAFIRNEPKSVSDILVSAATQCDDVSKVIVIALRGNNDLRITTNCDRYGLFGSLQAALSRVAEGGGEE